MVAAGVPTDVVEAGQALADQRPTFPISVTETADVVEQIGTSRRIDVAEIQMLQARSLDEAIRLLRGVYLKTGGDGAQGARRRSC